MSQALLRSPITTAVALAAMILLPGVTVAADGKSNVFADAAAIAQQRCVKIYGAGIGREVGYATGIIVSADGQILTASGVILAGSQLRVVLPDGSVHPGQVLRRDDALQTALIKIDAETPQYFEVPNEVPAGQGDWILAVSNLFKVAEGAEPLSVTLGIISLRTQVDAKRGFHDSPYAAEGLLIDAITSNPGAAGGAVVDVEGRFVGMIGKIMESKSAGTRLNFAVPADSLRRFLDQQSSPTPTVVTTEEFETGIKLFTLGGKRAPAYVDKVIRGSPADQAGVAKDDLILSIGGQVVRDVAEYQKAEAVLSGREEIAVLIKRKEQILALKLTPADSPEADGPAVNEAGK